MDNNVKIGKLALPYFFFLSFGISLIAFTYKSLDRTEAVPQAKPPEDIEHFSLGHDNLLADLLWLRLVQDFDYCGLKQSSGKFVNEGQNLKEILNYKTERSQCHLSWTYHMLEEITDLDPLFKDAYSRGATILSIIVDDREGASRIFNKGLRYNKSWSFLYKAAYHELYEMRNAEKAAELLNLSYRNGGPQWLPILASRLYTEVGQAVFGVSVLEDLIANGNLDNKNLEQAQMRLKELKSGLAEAKAKEIQKQPLKNQ